ncbi:MAG TPA: outer membrane lipid asymmetry maintenance protein MlaD [Nitrospirae bacterium]|nr:putative phospholipid ABC transporter-binding protein MlaD [bacterium BMS3Bbin09]HDH34388.1 outer membrane lipid asymmetry maintenance protein MlaD [Nitrospirota bacterium]HDN95384.1 outer membrane lipid asymmetry maintenance protein MlaD [Nitrospirota bacterium]HDO66800.1 outer membrane lipid asymmetry maintenance protein MlaD [Nitrospirota bacterium]HDZ84870.1 outer membrane lipid asymmetry maintenance protein MlaD [Nitrospirota bacterium]
MRKINVETGVGIFIIVGMLCLGYLSLKLGDVNLFGTEQYVLRAHFTNVSGLKEGAMVELAGVRIGKVSKIYLDDYEALVEMLLDPDVKLQEDAIASIRTQGIIGDKYIKIKTGGADEMIGKDGEIIETESAIELEELVSKYMFGKE